MNQFQVAFGPALDALATTFRTGGGEAAIDENGEEVIPSQVYFPGQESEAVPEMTYPGEEPEYPVPQEAPLADPTAGVVPEQPGAPMVPGPSSGPSQAIPPPQQRPAQSIKEYLDIMRSKGQAPRFTNISQDQGQEQAPGEVGGSYFMPERGRVITTNPGTGAYQERGTMNAKGMMKESPGGYDPSGDPFQGATDLAMQDAPRLWDMMTGGGVPMDAATPDQYKKFSAMLGQVRDQYLSIATKRREEFVKLVAAGYDPHDVRQLMMGGGSMAGLKKVADIKGMSQKDFAAAWKDYFNAAMKRQAESGMPEDSRLAADEANKATQMMFESMGILMRQKGGPQGAASQAPPAGGSTGKAAELLSAVPPERRQRVAQALSEMAKERSRIAPNAKSVKDLTPDQVQQLYRFASTKFQDVMPYIEGKK